VGRYARNHALARAVAEALQDDPRFRFRFVVSRENRSHYERLPNVVTLSDLSDAKLLDEYQRAACLLLTVHLATANNAVLEAMACGLPVVCERLGGLPEYVPDTCGLLVSPGDRDALVGALRRLADDSETCLAMGRAARGRAEELDWRLAADAHRAVYREVWGDGTQAQGEVARNCCDR
jgi:glycosyltransferase involved in cell wall biosynthesis